MKTLDRYIVRNFLYSALLCFVVLMSMRIIGDLFFNVDEFVKQHGGEERTFAVVLDEIYTYYSYQSFAYFRELSGVIIVAAAAFTLARMNHTNELTAILASGVSLHRVLLPILLCAVGMDALVVIDNEVFIPRYKEYLVRTHDDATGADSFRVRLIPDENRAAWYAYRYYPRQQTLEEPMVILRDDRYGLLGHISAVSGQYNVADNGWAFRAGTDKTGLHPAVLHVPGVVKSPTSDFVPTFLGPEEIVQAVKARPENADVDWARAKCISDVDLPDERAGLTIRGSRLELEQSDGKPVGTVLHEPRFLFRMGQCDVEFRAASARFEQRDNPPGWKLDDGRLVYHSPLTPRDLALRQSGQWTEYMSTSELAQLTDLGQASDPDKLLLLRHSRFADFLNNIILLLIAVPFILSRERNLKSSAGLTVLTVGSVYILIYLTRYIGLPPVLAAWLPILICGPLAVLTVDSVKT